MFSLRFFRWRSVSGVHFHKAFGWFRVFTFIRRLVGIGRSSFPWRLVGSVVDMPRRNPARACRLPQQPQQQQQARAVSFNYNRKPRFQIPIGIGTTLVFIRYLEVSILALLLDSPLINFAPICICMPIRKYVLPILLQPFPQHQMSRKEIREYITSNADEDGNLWCYLTVSFNKHKQFTWIHFPYARTANCHCHVYEGSLWSHM